MRLTVREGTHTCRQDPLEPRTRPGPSLLPCAQGVQSGWPGTWTHPGWRQAGCAQPLWELGASLRKALALHGGVWRAEVGREGGLACEKGRLNGHTGGGVAEVALGSGDMGARFLRSFHQVSLDWSYHDLSRPPVKGFFRLGPLPGTSPTLSLLLPHPPVLPVQDGRWSVLATVTQEGQHTGPALSLEPPF